MAYNKEIFPPIPDKYNGSFSSFLSRTGNFSQFIIKSPKL